MIPYTWICDVGYGSSDHEIDDDVDVDVVVDDDDACEGQKSE